MKTVYHQPTDQPRPARGDLLRSNIGTRRERTWLVLSIHQLPTRFCPEMGIVAQRTKIWAERWWELEPATRMALFQSAERRGAQLCFEFYRFRVKRKPTFEQHMRRTMP